MFVYGLYYQVMDYLARNNLLCMEQYGFRLGYSTELDGIRLTDYLIKQVDSVKLTSTMDLSKGFNIINHTILFSKINYCDTCGFKNDLLRIYLSNR